MGTGKTTGPPRRPSAGWNAEPHAPSLARARPAGASLPFVESAERRSISQHLDWLQQQGRVAQAEQGVFYLV